MSRTGRTTPAFGARAPEPDRPARSERADQIVAAAGALLEQAGPDGLTMRALADQLGLRAPSLYKHFRNKAALELALVTDALWAVGRATHAAVDAAQSAGDAAQAAGEADGEPAAAVAALTAAYRREARRQPHRYRLATQGTLARDQLPPGLEEWAGNPWFRVSGDPALAQALWSFAHGMVVLELDRRYPPGSDLDATWAAGVAAFGTVDRRAIRP